MKLKEVPATASVNSSGVAISSSGAPAAGVSSTVSHELQSSGVINSSINQENNLNEADAETSESELEEVSQVVRSGLQQLNLLEEDDTDDSESVDILAGVSVGRNRRDPEIDSLVEERGRKVCMPWSLCVGALLC